MPRSGADRDHVGMRGIDANSGKTLDGLGHLRQSIRDVLTTPVGSRVLRRDYGSQLFELLDAPTNLSLRMDLIAATVDALTRWEPRLRVDRVDIAMPRPGQINVHVDGTYLPNGQFITIEGIEVS
jgi:phage baseplate assembly protein W